MAVSPSWLLLTALLCLTAGNIVSCQDDVEDSSDDAFDVIEKAFLLVRHKIDTVDLVQGKNTSVLVEVYNAGNRYPVDEQMSEPAAGDLQSFKVYALQRCSGCCA